MSAKLLHGQSCSLRTQLRLRLSTLLDKKRVMQQHPQSVSKTSSRYVALEEGLKQFSMDLNKLEVIGACLPGDHPS
jgi:hypothetical protein